MVKFECMAKFDVHPIIMYSVFGYSDFKVNKTIVKRVHDIIKYTALIKHMCDDYGYKVSEASHKLHISEYEAQEYYDGYTLNARDMLSEDERRVIGLMRDTGEKITSDYKVFDKWIDLHDLWVIFGARYSEDIFAKLIVGIHDYINTLRQIDFKYNVYPDNVSRGYTVAEVNYERIAFNPDGCYKEYCNSIASKSSRGDVGTTLNKLIELEGNENRKAEKRADSIDRQKKLKFDYDMVMEYLSELDSTLVKVVMTETSESYTIYAAFTKRDTICSECKSREIKYSTQSIKLLDLPYMGKLVYLVIINNTVYTCDKCGYTKEICRFAEEYKDGMHVTKRMSRRIKKQFSLQNKRFLNNISWVGKGNKTDEINYRAWFVGWVRSVYGNANILGYQSRGYDTYDVYVSRINREYNNLLCGKCNNALDVISTDEIDVTPSSFEGKVRVFYERLVVRCGKCGTDAYEAYSLDTPGLGRAVKQRELYEKQAEYGLLDKLKSVNQNLDEVILIGNPRDESVKQAIMGMAKMREYRERYIEVRNSCNLDKEVLGDLDNMYKSASKLVKEIDRKFLDYMANYGKVGMGFDYHIEDEANNLIKLNNAQYELSRLRGLVDFVKRLKSNMYLQVYTPLSNRCSFGDNYWSKDKRLNGYLDEHRDNIVEYIKVQVMFYEGRSLSEVSSKMGIPEKRIRNIMDISYNPYRIPMDNHGSQEIDIISLVDSGKGLEETYEIAVDNGYKHSRNDFNLMLSKERAIRHTILRAIWLVDNSMGSFLRYYKYAGGVDGFYSELDHYLCDRT